MENNTYFEQLCNDVYGYYGILRNVDLKKHALVMLRSMGEFWTEEELNEALLDRQESKEVLTFSDFRRLAKLKWYEPSEEEKEEQDNTNDDGYGNKLYMNTKDIKNFENAFNRVSEFYTNNTGPNKTLKTDVLYNMMTNYEDPMPTNVANYLVSNLHVYNNAVTARSLLCLLGRREKVQRMF